MSIDTYNANIDAAADTLAAFIAGEYDTRDMHSSRDILEALFAGELERPTSIGAFVQAVLTRAIGTRNAAAPRMSSTLADTVEGLIDRQGVAVVLEAVAEVLHAKAEHLGANWQEDRTAFDYTKAGNVVDRAVLQVERELGSVQSRRS